MNCHISGCPVPADDYGFCHDHLMKISLPTRDRLVESLFIESRNYDREAALKAAVDEAEDKQIGLF